MFPASMTSTEPRDGGPLFPLTLKLTDKEALVVGGGAVAARKAAALLRAGARVTVVAPELGSDLKALLAEGGGRLRHEARRFVLEDPAGAVLVVAATDDADTNREIASAARARRALVNVVDDAGLSDVLLPSVLERGSLQIAVSTSGEAPALAVAVRRRLERLFPEEWAEVVQLYGAARRGLASSGMPADGRRRANRRLAEVDVADILAHGGLPAVREVLDRVLAEKDPPVGKRGEAPATERGTS